MSRCSANQKKACGGRPESAEVKRPQQQQCEMRRKTEAMQTGLALLGLALGFWQGGGGGGGGGGVRCARQSVSQSVSQSFIHSFIHSFIRRGENGKRVRVCGLPLPQREDMYRKKKKKKTAAATGVCQNQARFLPFIVISFLACLNSSPALPVPWERGCISPWFSFLFFFFGALAYIGRGYTRNVATRGVSPHPRAGLGPEAPTAAHRPAAWRK